jgi:hypothetical protein
MNWRAAVFWVVFYAATGTVLLGVVEVYNEFGLPAMYGAVLVLFLLCVWMERRRPVYLDDGDPFMLGGDRQALPSPGKKALPGPGAPRITRSQRPALPGPKK